MRDVSSNCREAGAQLSGCGMSRLAERDTEMETDSTGPSVLHRGLGRDPELSEQLLKRCRSGWVCPLEKPQGLAGAWGELLARGGIYATEVGAAWDPPGLPRSSGRPRNPRARLCHLTLSLKKKGNWRAESGDEVWKQDQRWPLTPRTPLPGAPGSLTFT